MRDYSQGGEGGDSKERERERLRRGDTFLFAFLCAGGGGSHGGV